MENVNLSSKQKKPMAFFAIQSSNIEPLKIILETISADFDGNVLYMTAVELLDHTYYIQDNNEIKEKEEIIEFLLSKKEVIKYIKFNNPDIYKNIVKEKIKDF